MKINKSWVLSWEYKAYIVCEAFELRFVNLYTVYLPFFCNDDTWSGTSTVIVNSFKNSP